MVRVTAIPLREGKNSETVPAETLERKSPLQFCLVPTPSLPVYYVLGLHCLPLGFSLVFLKPQLVMYQLHRFFPIILL